MSTRAVFALTVAIAVAVSAVTAILEGGDASAAAGGGNSAEEVNQQLSHDLQAQLSVRGQILAQIRATRKETEASLAAIEASGKKTGTHTAVVDPSTAAALVPMGSIAKDDALLTESSPAGYDLSPQLTGLIPRLLAVWHGFCVDAETTAWGHRPRSRPAPQNCDVNG